MSAPGAAPRRAAIAAVAAVAEGRRERLDDGAWLELPPADRALARELAHGALTHHRLYDWLAARLLRRAPAPEPLASALRVLAHQLFALDRIPPHAALDSTVEALRALGGGGACRVLNAIGRRWSELCTARHGEGPLGRLPPAAWPSDLAIRHSLPDALRREVEAWLGPQPEARWAALALRPPLCTRTRPGSPPPAGRSILRREGPWTWWDDPEEALHGPVAEGRCAVQDRTQGRVVEAALGVARARPGDWVLDLCAAPGGKALALHDAGLRVIAADRQFERLRRAPNLLARVVADGRQPPFASGFDLVLVDAPCTNSGVFARRPEARLRYTPACRDALAELQRSLLASAAALAAPDGRLVYATCSLSPAENQGVAHCLPGWRLLGEELTWPDRWQGGGYWAVLVRSDA